MFAPMELHVPVCGNTNRIDNNLKKINRCNPWIPLYRQIQSLDFQRPKLHGGQFKGGECSKLLKNVHVLEELIESWKLEKYEHINSVVNSFKYLKSVKVAMSWVLLVT